MAVPKRKSGSSKPGHRVGLSVVEEERLRRKLGRVVCSAPWLDAQFPTVFDTDGEGEEITYRFHDPNIFPPGKSQTRMIRCSRCGRWTPPNAMEGEECLDHADGEGWGISPSALGIQRLQMRQGETFDRMLPPETERALLGEIRRFKEKEQSQRRSRES